MKIALYRTTDGHESVHIIKDWVEEHPRYTRISDVIDVPFTMIDSTCLELEKIETELGRVTSEKKRLTAQKENLETQL